MHRGFFVVFRISILVSPMSDIVMFISQIMKILVASITLAVAAVLLDASTWTGE